MPLLPFLIRRLFVLIAFSFLGLLAPHVASAQTQAAPVPAPLPTLWLIGDSTVKNGKELKGWGQEITPFFDTTKINIQNRALGGRSSRTFMTEGLWEKVQAEIKPGDFVLMQFGHNDAGSVTKDIAPGRPSRASLKGNGEETQEIENTTTGQKETVHTYGWYLRQFIAGAKAKGATPVVLSMVPRNDWKEGKVLRVTEGFAKWAAEAAGQENVPFIDLNAIVANHYDALGEEAVKAFFPKEHTHTNEAGAQLNARSVVEGLQARSDIPLGKFLLPAPAVAPTTHHSR